MGLWGDELSVPSRDEIKGLLSKIKKAKKPDDEDVGKQIKSDKIPLEDRLAIIKDNVYKILGRQKDNTILIKTKEDLHAYMDAVIESGFLALDTETNNTLDYINCRLMGPCLYTPGQKQAYVPMNHVDPKTGDRLPWQLTEIEFRDELQRVIDAGVKIIFHNYKFDYQVIKTTCHIEVPAYWDTMIGIKMIDENEKAKLKFLYSKYIDPTQEKYDIEHLFDAKYVQYAQVDPEVFALYAATDSMITYKMYLYEKSVLETPEYKGMLNIFLNVEMPIISTVAEMEYNGIGISQAYAKRLSEKYHREKEAVDAKILEEMAKIQPKIDAWRLTPGAREKDGKKEKCEILENPVNLDSPKQLAILLFDVLKLPEGLGKTINDTPRGTGTNVLEIMAKDYGFGLGTLLSEKKGIDKLLSTFIDALPQQVNPKDGKIHCSFNQLGAIARFSSSSPNLQNIPSSDKSIRPMFNVNADSRIVSEDGEYEYLAMAALDYDNSITVDRCDEVKTKDGYVGADAVAVGDSLVDDEGNVHEVRRIFEMKRDRCFILG